MSSFTSPEEAERRLQEKAVADFLAKREADRILGEAQADALMARVDIAMGRTFE